MPWNWKFFDWTFELLNGFWKSKPLNPKIFKIFLELNIRISWVMLYNFICYLFRKCPERNEIGDWCRKLMGKGVNRMKCNLCRKWIVSNGNIFHLLEHSKFHLGIPVYQCKASNNGRLCDFKGISWSRIRCHLMGSAHRLPPTKVNYEDLSHQYEAEIKNAFEDCFGSKRKRTDSGRDTSMLTKDSSVGEDKDIFIESSTIGERNNSGISVGSSIVTRPRNQS